MNCVGVGSSVSVGCVVPVAITVATAVAVATGVGVSVAAAMVPVAWMRWRVGVGEIASCRLTSSDAAPRI
jgi:hypothetical protein